MQKLALIILTAFCSSIFAQNCDPRLSTIPISPKKAFEIISILVDACDGNKEGQNEMIRLRTGKYALDINNFFVPNYQSGLVNWGSASNPWRDFSPLNSSLSSKVKTLNANIKSSNNCGFFKFLGPTDQIPPNSDVLIITSADFNPNAHDFGGLNDTVFLLIQNKGNTAGHFANYNGTSGTRTLILLNSGYGDTVTYNINSLIKQNGSKGSEDGAGVEFTYNGNPTYVNYGCKIPYPEFKIDAGKNITLTCLDSCLSLKGTVEGYNCVRWFSTSGGYFDDSSKLDADFCLPNTATPKLVLYLIAKTACGKQDIDSLIIWNQTSKPMAYFEVDSIFKPNWVLKNSSQNSDNYKWIVTSPTGKDTQWTTKNLADIVNYKTNVPGYYHICLVSSFGFCRDTFCQKIYHAGATEPFIYIANVFTPGSKDGLNDEFRVESKGLIHFSIKIFNRWGATVFQSNDADETWNGRVQNQGENCPAGSYFYLLDYQLQGSDLKKINGAIKLIR